jgi:hypothetical protein
MQLMTLRELESLCAYLTWEWALSDCEHDDILSLGALFSRRYPAEAVRLHLEMRAEVITLVGSDMEEMCRAMQEHTCN